MRRFILLLIAACLAVSVQATKASSWNIRTADELRLLDDDIARNSAVPDYFDGIKISEYRFSENGFDWHLIRFASTAQPNGPLWMVPHDDENAAFEAVIAALKVHGGVAVVVNSGLGSARRQAGNGTCGVSADVVTLCDPNRNFSVTSPKFTDAFLSQRAAGQPTIALHTNSPGFLGDGKGGRGEITILDARVFARGKIKPRPDGYFAINPTVDMANYDTLGLTAYLSSEGKPAAGAIACRKAMTGAGVHFWHERVMRSDGSMSNFLALNYPGIAYFNAESRLEVDLGLASARHKVMVATYLNGCVKSGGQPVP